MKAIIENPIKLNKEEIGIKTHRNEDAVKLEVTIEFTSIVNTIALSENHDQLQRNMSMINMTTLSGHYFLYGFGSSHMWVKQIINGEPKQQVIFVAF